MTNKQYREMGFHFTIGVFQALCVIAVPIAVATFALLAASYIVF